MYINFQQNQVNRSVITAKQSQVATTNSNLKKNDSLISDAHHRKTYMYINFQQNRVSRSVKTVHTNVFATTNSNLEKIDYLRHASS